MSDDVSRVLRLPKMAMMAMARARAPRARALLLGLGLIAATGSVPAARAWCESCWLLAHYDSTAVYHDMHDGDYKRIVVNVSSATVTITPHANNESWVVEAALDAAHCSASVDFHVAGKPSPPPVKSLEASFWTMSRASPQRSGLVRTHVHTCAYAVSTARAASWFLNPRDIAHDGPRIPN